MPKFIAIIPARKGSKGVRNKNFRSFFAGKSLVDIAIEFCTQLNVDEIYVSTDRKSFCASHSNVKVHCRNPLVALDNSTDFDVLLNLAADGVASEGDALVWIRPTSPLRSPLECNKSNEKFKNGFGSIRSIKEASIHPFWMKKIENERLVPFSDEGNDRNFPRRQLLPMVYQISSEFEIVDVKRAIEQQTFYPEHQSYLITETYPKVDIDTDADFQVAQLMYERMK